MVSLLMNLSSKTLLSHTTLLYSQRESFDHITLLCQHLLPSRRVCKHLAFHFFASPIRRFRIDLERLHIFLSLLLLLLHAFELRRERRLDGGRDIEISRVFPYEVFLLLKSLV